MIRFLLGFFALCYLLVGSVVNFVAAGLSFFKVDPRLAIAGGFSSDVPRSSGQVSNALFNFNRHESNVARRSAERHV